MKKLILIISFAATVTLGGEAELREQHPDADEVRIILDQYGRKLPNLIVLHKDGSIWEYREKPQHKKPLSVVTGYKYEKRLLFRSKSTEGIE